MNAIFFGVKRAYQSTLRVTRRGLELLGLTAARFDMMTAIGRFAFGPRQADLRAMLGVTAPTISRMLTSLEKLGLVLRRREPTDRRQRRVSLTETGRVLLCRATRLLIESGAVQLAVDCALVGPDRCHDDSACLVEMEEAESLFERMRTAYRDVARLHYPWHPDD